MKKEIKIGGKLVGDGYPCYLIGEIGINHNGNIDIAKNLITVAKNAGWNAVKFQKRTIDIVYTAEETRSRPSLTCLQNVSGFQRSASIPPGRARSRAERVPRARSRTPAASRGSAKILGICLHRCCFVRARR